MMCYRDHTFCSKSDKCHKDCYRRLTQEQLEHSKELGLLVSYAEFKCSEEVEESTTDSYEDKEAIDV